jgi:uncharacterized protein
MLSDVKLLLEIQELDQEILEVNGQIALYPKIWEEVKQKIALKKQAYHQAESDLESHQKARRSVEQDIRLYSEELRRSQAQQRAIKTSKEFDAINKQIESLKAKMSELETAGLELIGKDEVIDANLKEASAELEEIQGVYLKEKERIRVQFNEKKTRINVLAKDKAKFVARVKGRSMIDYNRIFKRHPGTVTVPVRGGSCSGCHFGLVPNDLIQVHQLEKVVYCPNCGRILSHDEDYIPEDE